MIYIIYEKYKKYYYDTQNRYNEILTEKERLFSITQPKATDYGKEKASGGKPSNPFDEYLIQKEKKQIDARLKEVKSLLEDRERLLRLKRDELRASNNIHDKIYRYRYIDKMRVQKIVKLVGYSEAQVYRILKVIKNNIK